VVAEIRIHPRRRQRTRRNAAALTRSLPHGRDGLK
jgi:hypothetical protein